MPSKKYHSKKTKSRKTRHRKTKHRKTKHRKTSHRKTKRRQAGGNYQRDVTTRTTEGVATKELNKFVVTMPGYSAMSGTAYKRLMEDRDRNGNDEYD